jgi:hypothetical protein
MSTIYFPRPNDDKRAEAIDDLMDTLVKLYPDHFKADPAIAVTTDLPEIEQMIASLAGQAEPPAEPKKRAIKATKAARLAHISASSLLDKVGNNGHGAPNTPVETPAGDPPVEEGESAEAASRKKSPGVKPLAWNILKNGKKLTDPYYLLKTGKLQPGDRVKHDTRGIYEVGYSGASGELLTLKRIAS